MSMNAETELSGSSKANREGAARSKRAVTPRSPKLGFEGVPRHWFAESAAATHLVNGVNLLFPLGERFFIRAVRHYQPQIEDEVLRAQVKGFFVQEGKHAHAHERFFDTLREQGYEIDAFLRWYDHLAYDVIEKMSPPAFRLAVTVALEHFTALLAEDALASGDLEHTHPSLQYLLEWHALEELEHKAVAFDVLRHVHPSYPLRIAGFLFGATVLGGFWVVATRELLKQDGMSLRDFYVDLRRLQKRAAAAAKHKAAEDGASRAREVSISPVLSKGFLRGVVDYFRPSFHPMDKDHTDFIATTLARLERQGILGQPQASPSA